eukprot:1551440-Amphidinium_carterae.1
MDDDEDVHITSEHDRSSDEFSHVLSELSHYYEKTPAPLAYTRSNVWTGGTRPRSVCLGAYTDDDGDQPPPCSEESPPH